MAEGGGHILQGAALQRVQTQEAVKVQSYVVTRASKFSRLAGNRGVGRLGPAYVLPSPRASA